MRSTPAAGQMFLVAILVLFTVIMQSCDDSETIVQSENSPPGKPLLDPITGAPRDGSEGQLTTPVLSWECSDIDKDPLTFDVYLGTGPTPPLVSGNRTTSCYVPAPLTYKTTYRWRVEARDNHGHVTSSDTWSFTTHNEPLTCNAAGSPATGKPPLLVSFTGSASGGEAPYSYVWTFGDGAGTADQNPDHTYAYPGNYNATLKVTDAKALTCSKKVPIVVEGPLTCHAAGNPTVGAVPLTVSFEGEASGGHAPYSYAWLFGDGESSTLQHPVHTYRSLGTFAAILTVTDVQSVICSKTVTIYLDPPLSCNAMGSPASGPAPLTVNFTATASGGHAPYSFVWTFGDGGGSNAQNPSHTYTEDGIYRAVLWVTDARSRTCSKTLNIVPF